MGREHLGRYNRGGDRKLGGEGGGTRSQISFRNRRVFIQGTGS